MLMLKRILALMIKEFRSLLTDKKSRMVIIVPPVAQIIVFGYAASYDLTRVTYAVFNEDRGVISRDLLAGFRGSTVFSESEKITHDAQIAPLVEEKKVMLVIHVPPTFSEDLLSGRSAPLQIILDGRNSNTAMVALNYVQSVIMAFNTDWT